MTTLVALALKSVVLLAGALVAARIARTATMRHVVLASAIGALAALPVLSFVLPQWSAADIFGTSTPVVSPDWLRGAGTWIVGLWAAGTAVNLIVLVARLAWLAWLHSRCDVLRDHPLSDLAIDIGAEYRLSRPVTVLQSDGTALLGTWGVDPKVVVPAHAASWDAQRAEIVFRHELAHIRRHDWIIQTAAEVVRAFYWCNPLVWIACRQLRDESEHACDAAVLHAGIDSHDYAAHLVELARTLRPRCAWWPAAAMARPSTLERRVREILSPRTQGTPPRGTRVAAATAMFLLMLPLAVIGRPPVRHVVRVAQPPVRTLTLLLDGRIVDLSQGWPPTPDPDAGLVAGHGFAIAVHVN